MRWTNGNCAIPVRLFATLVAIFEKPNCVISFKCREIDFETGEKCVDVFESYRFYQRSYPPIETPVGQPLFPLTPSFISREIVIE